MSLSEVIERGINLAYPHGMDGAFYPHQYVASTKEWERKMAKLREECHIAQDAFYPDRANGGNAGPIGAMRVEEHDGYRYAYTVSPRGSLESRWFTLSL